jgi:hypothetical protein
MLDNFRVLINIPLRGSTVLLLLLELKVNVKSIIKRGKVLMRFKTAFERVLFIMPLLCASLLWGTASLAISGTIESPLDEMIAGADPGQKIGVILVMADKVDNAALNQQLKDRHATLEQRHYQVITTLQQKATLTQGPVQSVLDDLEAHGQV